MKVLKDIVIILLSILLILLCIGITSTARTTTSLPSDDWPMFNHDVAHTGTTTSSGPAQPTVLWNYTEKGFVGSTSPPPVIVNGIVYVGLNYNRESVGGNVYAFDAYNGAKLWNYSTSNNILSSPAVSGTLLFIGLDNNIIALDTQKGNRVWSYPTAGRVVSSPAVVDDKVYIGSFEGNLYALNASTGVKIWNYSTIGTEIQSSPAVVNNVVYFGAADYNVYALNASTGAKLWTFRTGYFVESSPAVSDGVVYVGSEDGNLYALNANSGEKIWSYQVSKLVQRNLDSSPTIANGVVYIRSSDFGELYAFDAHTGGLKWYNQDRFYGSAAIANSTVYIGSAALNISTGEKLWDFQTGQNMDASSAISNGVLYTASRDGYFYAIGKPLFTPLDTDQDSLNLLIPVAVGFLVVLIATLFYRNKHQKSYR